MSEATESGTTAPDVTPDTSTKAVPAEVAVKPAEAKPEKAAAAVKEADKKPDEPRKFTIKVNGKERVVDEKTAMAYLQREMAADEKFRSASAETKKIEALLKAAKNDPDKLIRELIGMDPLELAKKRVADEIKRMSMSPEQRELEEARQKLAAFEKKEQERQELERKSSEEKAKEFYVKKYDNEIPAALKGAGLPVNEDTVRYTAEVMLANLEEGLDLPYEVVMDLVKDKYQKSLKNFLTSADKEKLAELLGEDVLEGLLASRGKKGAPKRETMSVPDGEHAKQDPKFMSKEEFQKYIEEWSKK